MIIWQRIDRDTIQTRIGDTRYQIRVTGENASGKPTQWGLYKLVWMSSAARVVAGITDVQVWVEILGKPSRVSKYGSHIKFDKQSVAKRYVEMRTP